MSDGYTILTGMLAATSTKEALNAALNAGGYKTNVGTYAIRMIGPVEFVFRNLGGDMGEPTITASHDSEVELSEYSAGISATLAKAGIAHWIEIYGADEEYLATHKHHWPQK